MNYILRMRTLCIFALILILILPIGAQVTTSSLDGQVTDDQEALVGATIVALHDDSGTTYSAITNTKGYFSLSGLRVGGTYTVTVSYIGYKSAVIRNVRPNLSETYRLNVIMQPSAELDEVVITGKASRFSGDKTGAVTHIREDQWLTLPNLSRSLTDMATLSPYAQGTRFGGRDQRQNNYTVDGANFNYNMGLDGAVLPAGGSPISIDALEEMQVSIAPYDVRQSHFVGGSVNAVTKSGTNRFMGSAYTYFRSEHLRGNKVEGEDLGERPEDSRTIYGFTLGGPLLKNKLFFFVNGEYEHIPTPIHKWRTSADGMMDAQNYISRTTAQDMDAFSKALISKYGYNPGSYTDFSGVNDTYRLMARLDWNISDRHRLMFRYNYTSNKTDNNVVGAAFNMNGGPVSKYSMSFRGSCWTSTNSINSYTAELNSRIGCFGSNQLIASYTLNDANKRKGIGPVFPTIDILAPDETGKLYAYMNAGYDQHAWNNGIDEKSWSVTNNFTLPLGNHKLMAGFSYESTIAGNCYMRYGAGYYRYNSFDDFMNNAAPSAFGICYSLTDEDRAVSDVHYDEFSFYAQDEWNLNKHLKLNYGVRLDVPFYRNDRYANPKINDYDFNGVRLSTTEWPESTPLVAPRLGFVYDVFGDKSLKVRGGIGVFNGRFPLIFLSKMQEASGMLQHTYTTINDSEVLNALAGGIRDRNETIAMLKEKFPSKFPAEKEASVSNIATIDRNFKMPQVWKASLAADYRLPLSFPADITLEGTYTKDLNAILYRDVNIRPETDETMGHFSGPDNRLYYPGTTKQRIYENINYAILMTNTDKGYSYTLNATAHAEPVKNLDVMMTYTFTCARVMSNSASNQVDNAWRQEPAVNGPNYQVLHNSRYMSSPHRLMGQASYRFELFRHLGTLVSLYYEGMRAGVYTYKFSNDMNNDGVAQDLLYIPADETELNRFHFQEYSSNGVTFSETEQRAAFWNFVNQDSYLKKRKGKYTEAFGAYLPWNNRFNLRFVQDVHVGWGGTAHTLQVSVDIMNVGNLLNSSWGCTKDTGACNDGNILQYIKLNEQNEPIYTFRSVTADGKTALPTRSSWVSRNTAQCWQMMIGVKYLFK